MAAAPLALRRISQRPLALVAPLLRATALVPSRSLPQCARRSSSSKTKPSNPTSDFYKTFTRPIGKVLVLAIFTYQVAYWTWSKLESDEKCQEADATIAGLERTIDDYKRSKDNKKDP